MHVFRRVSILIIFIFLGCQCKNSTGPKKTGAFYIYNLAITIAPYNAATGRAGDFHFLSKQGALFLEFGAYVSSAPDAKPLPTFEYRLWKNASVFAMAPGKVIRFVYQEQSKDYEILVRSTVDEDWAVGYDHLLSPRVKMGDVIAVGDTLGKAGTWNDNWSRTEIMINNDATGLSYCPFACFTPDSVAVYEARLSRLMADWEAFCKNYSVWDEKKMVQPGCTMENMATW